jgi:hypothetical protein
MASKANSLNMADLKAQLKSALIFMGPSILAFLAVLTPAVSAIVPTTTEKLILITILKWGLDQLTGLVRRYLAGK